MAYMKKRVPVVLLCLAAAVLGLPVEELNPYLPP